MSQIVDKPYFKIGEVCDLTETQPYVLRFWESEFPTLAPEKSRTGQRIYRRQDIEMVRRIKTLLHEQEYTIAGARKVLENEGWSGPGEEGGSSGPHEGAVSEADRPQRVRSRAGSGAARARVEGDEQAAAARGHAALDEQLDAELRNIRAKLAHAEGELRAILASMDRHDES